MIGFQLNRDQNSVATGDVEEIARAENALCILSYFASHRITFSYGRLTYVTRARHTVPVPL